MTRWYFEPVFDSYVLAIGVTVLLTALMLAVRISKRLSARQRRVLIGLRTCLILLLFLGLMRPTVVHTKQQPQSASLLLLFDQSRSLSVADDAGGKTRWQTLRETLLSSAPRLRDVSRTYDLNAYAFDAQPVPRDIDDEGNIELPAEPTGAETDIGRAIHETLNLSLGKRVAGVILLSDGAQRVHRPQFDVQQAAQELSRRGYPLYTVTFGKPQDQSQARDVAIQNLRDQYSVFVRNELSVRGTLAVHGYVTQPIPVAMKVETPDGKSITVAATTLSASQNNEQIPFEFAYVPDTPGQHKLTIEAEPQDGELVTDNNRLTAYVNVLDGGLRALLLHSNPLRPETSFLERSIGSSPDIQLDSRFIDIRQSDQWPVDLRAELATEYDVYLLCDVDARALGPKTSQAIATNVEKGKGLLMTGGYHSFGPGGYGNSPLGKILPIRISRFEQQELGLDAEISSDLHIDEPLTMLPTRDHFLTRLTRPEENEAVWRQLPQLQGANRFGGIQQRAVVYARANDVRSGPPLLVGWPFGDGRVLAFAGDTTYRWWTYGYQNEHKRFWRQAMLWLAKKDAAQNQDVWIQLNKRRFLPGDIVRFSAGARGVDGEPLEQAQLRAELVFPDGSQQPISLSPEGESWNGMWEEVLSAGEYEIRVSADFEGKPIGETKGKFVVIQHDLELANPAANPELMQLLASFTSAAGGKAVPPEQFPKLLEQLQREPPKTEVAIESKWQLGDTPSSAWPYFALFCTLISVEWYLRKRWQLV